MATLSAGKLPKLRALHGRVNAAVKAAVFDGVHDIRNDIINSMRAPKTGEQYLVPGTKTVYTASSPGEAPGVATANLISNIDAKISDSGATGTVGLHDATSVKYGALLEFGTSSIEPRPWLMPAYLKNIKKIKANLKAAVKSGISK